MCGIVGILSHKPVASRLVEGLKRLEYRGYDSAGIATLEKGQITRIRAEGKIINLEQKTQKHVLNGLIGIAHTRWATHGKPSLQNAHPHGNAEVVLVHNGIIENHSELREKLLEAGHHFESETDTEVVAHLILELRKQNPTASHKEILEQLRLKLQGAYALVILFKDQPESLYGLRMASPLVVGSNSEGDLFFGSDALTLSSMASKVSYLEDGDLAVLEKGRIQIFDENKISALRATQKLSLNETSVQKGPYAHFMLKEIHEQPDALRRTLQSLVSHDHQEIELPASLSTQTLAKTKAVRIIACGTSYYAGLVAKTWFEQLAQTPVSLEIASEFRYFAPPLEKETLCIFISQSGETADTLAALKLVKAQKIPTLGIVNVETSSIARTVDCIMLTQAGPEIGVASTKAFTAQLTVLAALALKTAQIKNTLEPATFKSYLQELLELPTLIGKSLQLSDVVKNISSMLTSVTSTLYVGRGAAHAIALEGALKLKEISYIHAEAYAGGELKHGPIALIDKNTPTVAIIPHDTIFEKMLSNLEEIKARSGKIIAITDSAGAFKLKNICDECIIAPTSSILTMPFVITAPVQLLAYYVALQKGTDVDQPRNLAKSVTVE